MHKSKLVVKPHRPRRVRVMWSLLVLAGLAGGFLLLEYGQYRGGYNKAAASRQQDQLENEIAAVRAENDRLRERIALLETSLQVDHEAY
ncbi:MAG: hypothetical protein KJO85_09645, partial [Gammaproteobacteria bacterium]|nr:hypothetical protein [Gammaproteobacteria bacterium]